MGITSIGVTISVPPISLPDVFCTDRFGANLVLFDSSLFRVRALVSVSKEHRILVPKRSVPKWSRRKGPHQNGCAEKSCTHFSLPQQVFIANPG